MMIGAAMIAMLGFAHVLWACGVTWPARDREELAAYVAPRAMARGTSRFPSRVATLMVAATLFAMSASVYARVGVAVPIIAAIFALRGLGGLVYWSRVRESKPSPSPFFFYNRFLYSPGCLAIAALVASAT